MKDFTVAFSKFRIPNIDFKKEYLEDNYSDKSFDDDTIPDEEFNKMKKNREKLLSCPSVEQKGPNINLKIQHKRYSNQKEKKRQNYARIMSFFMTVIIKMNVVLHTELMN